MASYFSVIRFVPNPAANEAVNIGLLVASGDRVEVRSLTDWERVRCFAGASWREARRLIEELAENPKAFLGVTQVGTAEDLRAALSHWTRGLQFSDVRASLDAPDALMESLEPLVLVDQGVDLPQSRRAVVARTLYRAMSSAFELRFERKARGLVKKHALVAGQRTRHKVDVGVVNGSLYAGAFALTFSTDQVDRQWKDTDAVAFAVEDLRAARDAIPLGVVLDEPVGGTEASSRARALLSGMSVELLPVHDVNDWAQRAMTAVPDALVGRH